MHLAIPQQTVFTDGTQKTTGSVLLTTAPGTTLTSGQVQSVVNLVSSSVPGLTADQVSVSDSTGKVLSAAGDGNVGAAADDPDRRDRRLQPAGQRLGAAAARPDRSAPGTRW